MILEGRMLVKKEDSRTRTTPHLSFPFTFWRIGSFEDSIVVLELVARVLAYTGTGTCCVQIFSQTPQT